VPTKAFIPIPDDLEPVLDTCYEFQVPLDAQWLGMFWGALDQLGRWNSYERDVAHTALQVAERWRDIIALAREVTCPLPCPSFYPEVDTVFCPQNLDTFTARIVAECDGCQPHVIFSRSILSITSFVARIGYHFLTVSDDQLCGGHICQVRAYKTGIVGSTNWTLQWRDCLDVDHEELQTGDEFGFNDFDCKKLCLTSNDNFCAVVSVSGPVLCVEA